MAGYSSMKMKRKDLDDIYDEFSEFSLSSPARKIRRLDVELPPIMEEDDSSVPLSAKQQMAEVVPMSEAEISNEERALVLYKPVDNPFAMSPNSSKFSYTVSSDLVTGLKNKAFWPGNPRPVRIEEVTTDENQRQMGSDNSLAVIPWVRSTTDMYVEEPMEAEEGGDVEMEVDEDGTEGNCTGLHEWQQHCMIPQPLQNGTTPVMWSWL